MLSAALLSKFLHVREHRGPSHHSCSSTLSRVLLRCNNFAAEQASYCFPDSTPDNLREQQEKAEAIQGANGDESAAHRLHVHRTLLGRAVLAEYICSPPLLRPTLHQTGLFEGLHAVKEKTVRD